MPVAQHEGPLLLLRQPGDEATQRRLQLPILHDARRVLPAGKAFGQFIQGQICLSSAALLPRLRLDAVQGKAAGDGAEKHREAGGALVRHQVPRPEPGVADALLRVLGPAADAPGDAAAVAAVFLFRLGDGLIAALPVQLNDRCILHRDSSFIFVYTLYTTKTAPRFQ